MILYMVSTVLMNGLQSSKFTMQYNEIRFEAKLAEFQTGVEQARELAPLGINLKILFGFSVKDFVCQTITNDRKEE